MPFLPGYYPTGVGYITVGRSPVGVSGQPPPGTLFTSKYPGGFGYFSFGQSAFGLAGASPPLPIGPAIKKIIRSYLYAQYQDDDDLQSFVAAYNQLAQEYLDWVNSLNLPIYTQESISGLLLDWVAAGIYGMSRPVLSIGDTVSKGPLDTYTFDSLAFDARKVTTQVQFLTTTDDIFRRIITWHLQKSYGKYLTVRWLKRRIMQFLTGANGVPASVDQTYRISVVFGEGGTVYITLLKYRTMVRRSATFDSWTYDSITFDYEELEIIDLGPQFALAQAFKEAVADGVLEIPFQVTPVVAVQQ